MEKNIDDMMQHIIKEEGKKVKKLYAPIRSHESLSYYLNRLSKAELDCIRKRLGIKNASSLPKSGLVEAICPGIVNEIEYIFKNLGEMEFNLLEEIVRHGGVIEGDFVDYDELYSLQGWGIGFPGISENLKSVVILPDELIPVVKKCFKNEELIKAAKTGQKFYRIMKGHLYYYGVFPIMNLYDMIEENFPEESPHELMKYLFNNTGEDRDIGIYGEYFYHWMVMEPEHIIHEHKARPNLNYAQISFDRAIAAADDDYRDWGQHERDLYDFFIKTGKLSFEEAGEMVDLCIDEMKNDVKFTEIINYIAGNINLPDFKSAEKMLGILQNVYNGIPKWVLKGNTSNEVFEEEKKFMKPLSEKSPKVGRNEPCACGSGKKYKHCCGRN